MTDLKSKAALIADNGLFVELAPRLARDFGRVLYTMPWKSAYPRAAPALVGAGLAPNVERVLHFWDHVPEADVVIFPDVYDADAQRVCREQFGKPVWGGGRAEALELDRRGTRELQKRLGLAAPGTKFVTGLDALADYLKDAEDKWVKISCFRGDQETFHHQSWHGTSVWIDDFRKRLGALADSYEFMVENDVEGIEVGYDGWTVRGEYPDAAFFGYEVKDKGYIGRFRPYKEHPAAVRSLNAAFAPFFREAGSSTFLSLEFRLGGDGVPYLIDPCVRCGSPPIEATMEGYDNIAEIIWEGAHGRMAEARPSGEFVAMAMIHCQFALTNWAPIDVPEGDRRWVKIRNATVVGGKLYHVPTMGEMPEVGAVVAVADSLDEARALVKERAGRVKGYNLVIHTEALDAAEEEIEKGRDFGVEF